MALDTRQKRASAVHVALPFRMTEPVADGTVADVDRMHAALFYMGILAGAAASGDSSGPPLLMTQRWRRRMMRRR